MAHAALSVCKPQFGRRRVRGASVCLQPPAPPPWGEEAPFVAVPWRPDCRSCHLPARFCPRAVFPLSPSCLPGLSCVSVWLSGARLVPARGQPGLPRPGEVQLREPRRALSVWGCDCGASVGALTAFLLWSPLLGTHRSTARHVCVGVSGASQCWKHPRLQPGEPGATGTPVAPLLPSLGPGLSHTCVVGRWGPGPDRQPWAGEASVGTAPLSLRAEAGRHDVGPGHWLGQGTRGPRLIGASGRDVGLWATDSRRQLASPFCGRLRRGQRGRESSVGSRRRTQWSGALAPHPFGVAAVPASHTASPTWAWACQGLPTAGAW